VDHRIAPEPEELLRHLEHELGAFRKGFRPEFGDRPGFTVVAFGETSFASFGLSRHIFEGVSGPITQELVMAVSNREFAVNALTSVGEALLEDHRAIAHGERHRLPEWNEASQIQGVMAVPDPLVSSFDAATPRVDFMRLLAISDSEAAYARERGWEALVAEVSTNRIDPTDLFRDSAV
jgi:hypothetical protein